MQSILFLRAAGVAARCAGIKNFSTKTLNKSPKQEKSGILKKRGRTGIGQMSLSDYEYSNRKKKTKRDEFLEIMDEIIPWDERRTV